MEQGYARMFAKRGADSLVAAEQGRSRSRGLAPQMPARAHLSQAFHWNVAAGDEIENRCSAHGNLL